MNHPHQDDVNSAPFEGPEKLLEIWFAPSPAQVPDASSPENGRTGLRKIESSVWEDMLDIVRCKVLSTVRGTEIDAYLLSESSLFISPHRLILKTCGTTLNLLGLPRILEIAATHANMHTVFRCFYSRKSFMFPELQSGPHKDWANEVAYLDKFFKDGAAYTVGKMNGDHWLLYLAGPQESTPGSPEPDSATHLSEAPHVIQDYTIEILMSALSPQARELFYPSTDLELPSDHAKQLSADIGITDIFPPDLTTLDAYSFTPCGYSSNALIKWGDEASPHCSGEGYYTIHVTPEEGWSYASFECNVPLPMPSGDSEGNTIPDLKTLVERVVSVFQPGRLSLTLFISSEDNENGPGDSAVEAAQKAFKAALVDGPTKQQNEATNGKQAQDPLSGMKYRRTDKINYEFGGYDLAFASYELVQ